MQTICKEPDKYILINTLEANMQKCLIKNTINITNLIVEKNCLNA